MLRMTTRFMKKYWLVARNTWDEMTTYRLSFVMWRVRTVLQLLTVYFLWLAIMPAQGQLFGYSQSLMLTYVLGIAIVGAIVLSTRTHEIGENINKGDLSIFLLRPLNYFGYWFARDMGDKVMNVAFATVEIAILFFILQPPFYMQTNAFYLFLTIIAIFFAIVLHFFIGAMLGMIGFWSPDVWAPRFIFFILLTFFAGGLFPLDIFPQPLFRLFQFLPFTYLLYFPIKVYLGQLSPQEMIFGFFICSVWIFAMYILIQKVWRKGLTIYGAEGR